MVFPGKKCYNSKCIETDRKRKGCNCSMKSLLVFLKDYKKESILGPLFKLLEASFELFVPLVMAAIIDVGIRNGDRAYILRMCGVLILLAVIGLACSLTAQFFAAKAAVGFAAKLRHTLFAHIQSFSYSELDQMGTSTLITRMTSDVNQVQSGVNLVLRLFLRSPFIVIGAMIMAFTIDVQAALVFVLTIPLLSLAVFGIMFISIPLYRKVQAGLDQVLGITRENLAGVRVIRAFHKEEEEIEEFGEKNRDLTSYQLLVGKIAALMNPITYVIINLAIVALIWQGGVRVNLGAVQQGEVVALVNYMSQILVELVKLANLIITVNKSVACGNRIAQVLEQESTMEDGDFGIPSNVTEHPKNSEEGFEKEEPPYIIEFRDVSMCYKGSKEEAVSHISLGVKQGQTIGIIGGTGSGKSTVVNLIPRFYDVSAGCVTVEGQDVRKYRLETLRELIGVVPQRAVLFAGTIRENMKWGREEATDEEIWEALRIAQAAEFVEKKQGGLDAEIEQGGRNLSGGQRQRLTIARAIVRQPKILILDDSASALDYATDAALRRAIRQMEGQPTVFVVSQRTSSLMYADQILVLDDGEAVGWGTHEELLEHCEVYREIYDSQYGGRKEGA